MTKSYQIEGMSCQSCVARIKKALGHLIEIEVAEIQLESPQAILTTKQEIAIDDLQQAIGYYKITPVITQEIVEQDPLDLPATTWVTYKPLLLIVSFIFGVSLLIQYPFHDFSASLWMRHFMAGFFIVFSFFKLLNIEGFASSYQMYDLIAGRWKLWGKIYPFIELGLGILYLMNIAPFFTNLSTVIILGISSIGVIKSNLDKRKIKCACLGNVFNLPMSTVTIVEDLTMVLMAGIMLISL